MHDVVFNDWLGVITIMVLDVVVFFFPTVFLNRFDSLGGGVCCVLEFSPYEVGMVTPSEGYFSVWSY